MHKLSDKTVRILEDKLPIDDEVVYGKIGSFGELIHISELGEIVKEY